MRIIAGEFKGSRLTAPKGQATRPTSDRVRESIFNVLEHSGLLPNGIEGTRVLDVFAGSGAMGIEALSRGASFASFIDDSVAARAAIRQNIETTGTFGKTKILRFRAENIGPKPRRTAPFDLVFLDPPYREAIGSRVISTLIEDGWIAQTAAIVLETQKRSTVEAPADVKPCDERTYGETKVTFMERINASG